jgi:integrase
MQETETFEIIAREWYAKFSRSWASSHAKTTIRRLELFIFPWLGARPIKTITAPELLSALRRIEAKGALETAHRVKQVCGQVFRYAIATGRAERDPSGDLRGHGFRSMASTLLNEQGWNRDAIERQLAHAERNSVRTAYNHAEFLPERKKMMQAWTDYLEGIKSGAKIIPLKVSG